MLRRKKYSISEIIILKLPFKQTMSMEGLWLERWFSHIFLMGRQKFFILHIVDSVNSLRKHVIT
jgi:hypothetical protein